MILAGMTARLFPRCCAGCRHNLKTRFVLKSGISARAQLGMRHRIEPRLRISGQARENHRDVVAGVFVAGAGDDDAGTIQLAAVARRLQGNGHFGPFMERRRAAKFDAVFVDDHVVGGQFQPGLPVFDCDLLV